MWGFKLTAAGKGAFLCILAGTAMGLTSIDLPVYHLVITLSVAGAGAYLVNLAVRPKVHVEEYYPQKVVAGQAFEATFLIRNQRRLPAVDLSLGFFGLPPGIKLLSDPPVVPYLRRHQSVTVQVRFRAVRRGLFDVPSARPYSSFPFGLLRSGPRTAGVTPIYVLPDFARLHTFLMPAGARYQPGGVVLSSHVGESPEYIGNREYLPGDSTRHLDFKSWARLAIPVVREFTEEYYCRIALVLDTYVTGNRRARSAGGAKLEAGISLAASVAAKLTQGENVVDMFAAGPDLYIFQVGRNTAHLDNILEILACVDAVNTDPMDRIAPALAERMQGMSAAVFILLRWDEAREALVRAALENGCSVKVLLVETHLSPEALEHMESVGCELQVLRPSEVREQEAAIL